MDMVPKQRVRILIESRQDGQKTLQEALGELYVKGGHAYVRYEEQASELGRTTSLLRLEPAQIKIIRQGDVQSEQTFVAGEKRAGFYQTAQGKLELEMQTRELHTDLSHGLGTVSWKYDLYVAGDYAGLYKIKLSIREEDKDERS
jgi:uncharacterized beta-barrel protein YwiB (DUF1934 family)